MPITDSFVQASIGGRRGPRPIGPGPLEGLAWSGLYLLLAALPLAAALIPPTPPARGLWIEIGAALGFIALSMLGLQFALTARFRRVASPYGLDTQLHFHRQAGIVATVVALAHPVVLIAAEPAFLEFLDPRSSFVRAAALWVLLASLLSLLASTIWRAAIGLPYDWWRAAHGVLATVIVFIGLVHVLRVGHYVATPLKQAIWVAMSGTAIVLLLVARVLRPLHLRRRPYEVVEVKPEGSRSWTLSVVPVGHAGIRFHPGQFAWLTLGDSPFSLEQHPFSISSSAESPERLDFTVK